MKDLSPEQRQRLYPYIKNNYAETLQTMLREQEAKNGSYAKGFSPSTYQVINPYGQ